MNRKFWVILLTTIASICLMVGLVSCSKGTTKDAPTENRPFDKIKIGDTVEHVIEVLGQPDELDYRSLAWYGESARLILQRMKEIEIEYEEALKNGNSNRLNELSEEASILSEKFSNLYFDYLVVQFDNYSGLATKIQYDTVYNTSGKQSEKIVSKIEIEGEFYSSETPLVFFENGAEAREANHTHLVKIYYVDGSFQSYKQWLIPKRQNADAFIVQWNDDWGSYIANCDVEQQPIKAGSVATFTEGTKAWKFTALNDGTYDNFPSLSVEILSGDDFAFPSSSLIRSAITEITIPETLTYIKEGCFAECTKLLRIALPPNLVAIGQRAFLNCSSLNSITLPTSLTWIGDSAFSGCEALQGLIIPENVEHIGRWAFNCCTNLKQVTWNAIECELAYESYYRNNVFLNCNSIEKISFGENVRSIPDFVFQNCINIQGDLIIPDSVINIGTSAFEGCNKITSVMIGSGVTSIGAFAFDNCAALNGELIIPSSVLTIGYSAFGGCTNLKKVIFENTKGWVAIRDTGKGYQTFLVDVSDPLKASEYLTTVYCDCDWEQRQ